MKCVLQTGCSYISQILNKHSIPVGKGVAKVRLSVKGVTRQKSLRNTGLG